MNGFLIFLGMTLASWLSFILVCVLFMLTEKIIRWFAEKLEVDEWK